MKNKTCWNGYIDSRSYPEDDSLCKDEKKMYWIDVKEPRRSPLRLSRADDEDVFGWDVKKHLLAMMPHEKR
jgi:hypothetical protein